MKTLLCLAAVAALAVPAAALAETPSTANTTNAAKVCKAMRMAAGPAFTDLIASQNVGTKVTVKNAYGKCVSAAAKKDAAQEKTAKRAAIAECKVMTKEQLNAAGFGDKPNAYGKCVSAKAKTDKADADKAELAKARTTANAAKQCKAEGLKGKAFGKCVSATAKAQNDAPAQP